MKIVFIGAGRLANALAMELHNKSFDIVQVYSRTVESAKALADKINAPYTNRLSEIDPTAEIYVFSVKDSVLEDVVRQFPVAGGLWVHTSGSIPVQIFEGYTSRYGVLYPFQTFSKNREADFKEIPFFVESNNERDLALLHAVCHKINNKVCNLSSEKRRYLHLTGVFACNFVNHMYAISGRILRNENIPFDVLLPLIDETAAKVHTLSPQEAQTGPAVRYDENIINEHLELIADPVLKSIYALISESIHNFTKNN